ncbi:MAG: bile acid:sodium symporter family protein [Myxococcota bacterium]
MNIDDLTLSFDATGLAVLDGALALVMFGVALDLRVADFVALARDPRAPAVGLVCQFLLLPALTVPLALAVAPTPSVALGMILVASCPGGNVSNAITHLAGGRVGVSVGMTAVSTAAAVVITPLNLWFWGSRAPSTAALVHHVALDPLQMALTVAVVLALPCTAGMAVAARWPDVARRVVPYAKAASAVFFVGVVAVAFAANLQAFEVAIGTVFAPVALLNAVALALGYGAARLAGLPEPDRRAVCIEVGIQNSGLGLALIFSFFGGLGGMAAVAAWWGIWHIVAGLTLAGVWTALDRRAAR